MKQYIEYDIVDDFMERYERGEFMLSKKMRQAIKRHYKDIEKSKDENYKFEWVLSEAWKPIKFIETLPDPKSKKPNTLAPFQKLMIGLLYGWREKKTGFRRFRKGYFSLARKQGKSLIVAGLELYEFLFGAEPVENRQVYSLANSKDQANISFKMARKQLGAVRAISPSVKRLAELRKYDVEHKDGSIFKALASDADTLDGLDVTFAMLDEYALTPNEDLMSVIESSQSQQFQPLTLIVSTASSKLNYPMYAVEYQYVTKLLNGDIENDRYLALVFEQDDPKEYDQPETWSKSNPLMSVESLREHLLEYKVNKYKEHKDKGNMSAFITKELNGWVLDSTESYISAHDWELAKDESFKNIDLSYRPVYIGVDLSRVNDLTAVSWAIPIKEEKRILVDTMVFVATRGGIGAKEEQHKIRYRDLQREGYCRITTREDGMIDYSDMIDFIVDLVESNKLQLEGIYYDPYNGQAMTSQLGDIYPTKMFEVRQGLISLNSPTKELRKDIETQKVVHTNNPFLTMGMYNAIVKATNDTIQIDKNMNRNKIDPVDALINAWTEAQHIDFDADTVLELYENDNYGFGI